MAIELDSIEISSEFADLCGQWHGGVDTILYAISSTGGLTRGLIRPKDDSGKRLSDEAWFTGLFGELESELSDCVQMLEKHPRLADKRDLGILRAYRWWAEEMVGELRSEYKLDD